MPKALDGGGRFSCHSKAVSCDGSGGKDRVCPRYGSSSWSDNVVSRIDDGVVVRSRWPDGSSSVFVDGRVHKRAFLLPLYLIIHHDASVTSQTVNVTKTYIMVQQGLHTRLASRIVVVGLLGVFAAVVMNRYAHMQGQLQLARRSLAPP